MYLRNLFTPGQFITAALCKALQVGERIMFIQDYLFKKRKRLIIIVV